jgi:hypothetical protein
MTELSGFYKYYEFDDGVLRPFGQINLNMQTAETWKSLEEKIVRFRYMDEDWDNEGAPVFDDDQVDSAINFLHILRESYKHIPSRVIASQDGEIVFEWQGDDYYIEATIAEPGREEWLCDISGIVSQFATDLVYSQKPFHETSPVWSQYDVA